MDPEPITPTTPEITIEAFGSIREYIEVYLMSGFVSGLHLIDWVHGQSLEAVGYEVAQGCAASHFSVADVSDEARAVAAELPGASDEYMDALHSPSADALLVVEVATLYR